MASLSHARLSAADEYGGEGAAGTAGTPGGRADRHAPEGSPWEAKSPGDSPRSRIPVRMDSTSGERRQACTSLLSSMFNAEPCLLNHCGAPCLIVPLSADIHDYPPGERVKCPSSKLSSALGAWNYMAVMPRQSSSHLALSGLAGTLLGGLPDEIVVCLRR